MKILINNRKIQHESRKPIHKKNPPEANEIKQLLQQEIAKKNQHNQSELDWIEDDDTVVVNSSNALAIHTFLLKIEALGKDYTCTNQTVISIK